MIKSDVKIINEEILKNHLYCPELPDPDMIIRTGGEYRLSNFLLRQSAYAEIYVCDKNWPDFDVEELDHEHEEKIGHGMITHFPEFTSPFWNMSRNTDGVTSKKIDVILGGMETIGSAERSTDVEQMRDTFHTITNGEYSELLFKLFGKDRVEAELEKFLEFDFFPRVGGGIGMTRMISALDKI